MNYLRFFLVGSFLCFESMSFAQTPPFNDDFTNKIILTGSPITFSGTLANATFQSNERFSFWAQNHDASVWWSWTAAQSGSVTVEVLNFSTNDFKLGSMAAWTGTNATNLSLIAETSLDSGRHPFFTFSATAGTAYHLQIVGVSYGDFTLKLTATNKPIIMIQPLHRTLLTNGSTFFGVVAAGAPPLSYQWQCNGTNLSGETFPILRLDNLSIDKSGNYTLFVSNADGTVASDPAILNVTMNISPPQLMATSSADGQFYFKIMGDLYRSYRIQSSTNLTNWSEENSFPNYFNYYSSPTRQRNGVVFNQGNSFSVARDTREKFYRAISYTAANEVCINNLAQLRFATEIWALNHGAHGGIAMVKSNLDPFLRTDELVCPFDVAQFFFTSYVITLVRNNPVCQIDPNHLLEEPEF